MSEVAEFINSIKEFLIAFGISRGLLSLFFVFAHIAIFKLYKRNMNDKQTQIDRIASENHEYRIRFTQLLDDKFGFKQEE